MSGPRRIWRRSWAGCRWRWSRPLPTSWPPGPPWPGTGRGSRIGARTCWPRRNPGAPGGCGGHLGLGLIPASAGQPGRGLFQLIADAYTEDDTYGPEHPATLVARGSLAYWTGDAGDAAGARDQCAALLPVVERVLGAEHPVRPWQPGRLDRGGGDAAGARVLGTDHPYTVETRVRLAGWTGTAGDAAGARDQFAAPLPIQERVSGPEHPDTLRVRANLARFTGESGDAAGARDQLAALVPILERVSGPEHPATLATRGNLARWTEKAEGEEGA
jgi:tetratricopeptide repeat protein